MKERQILFSGPMVRAILEGRKTQTRRVVKTVRGYEHNSTCRPDLAADPWVVWWHGESERVGCLQECPFGAPGDRLWVRETWLELDSDGWVDSSLPKTELTTRYGSPRVNSIAYRAETDADGDQIRKNYGYKWRPSIFMPRWASRLTLEVVAVRVERLQEISEADAIKEGCEPRGWAEGVEPPAALDVFEALWDAINGKRSPWASNPWVWVVEFKVAA